MLLTAVTYKTSGVVVKARRWNNLLHKQSPCFNPAFSAELLRDEHITVAHFSAASAQCHCYCHHGQDNGNKSSLTPIGDLRPGLGPLRIIRQLDTSPANKEDPTGV